MTEPLRPPDDELVSAHLDGEASVEDAARVDADPIAQARRAEFEAIRTAVGHPVEVPTAVREASIAAALDVFDLEVARPGAAAAPPVWPARTTGAPAAHEVPGPAPAPPIDLAARRARLGRIQLLSAAAALVVVLFVAGAIGLGLRSSKDTATQTLANAPATTTATRSAEAAKNEQTSSLGEAAPTTPPPTKAAADAATGNAPTTTAPGAPVTSVPLPTTTFTTGGPTPTVAPGVVPPGATNTPAEPTANLGDLGSPTGVRQAVADYVTAAGAAPQTTAQNDSGPVSCESSLRQNDIEIGGRTLWAEAVYQGTPAFVLVFAIDRTLHPAANGATRIYTVDRTTCAVLSNQTT